MSTVLAPPFIYLIAAVLCPLLAPRWRALLLLGVPVVALLVMLSYAIGTHATLSVIGFELAFMRVDKLSLIFGIIFSIAAFLSGLYAWHVRDTVQLCVFDLGAANRSIPVNRHALSYYSGLIWRAFACGFTAALPGYRLNRI